MEQGAGGSCLEIALIYVQAYFQSLLLFCSGVSLLATLIGGLKHVFSSFALGRYAQASFQPFCFFVFIGNNSGKAIMRHMFVEKEPSLLIMNIDRSQ